MNWLFQQEWFLTILGALALGIASIITIGFANLNAWISRKLKNEKLERAILKVSDLVRDAILFVQQTYVEEMKKNGKFDKEAQKEALRRAMEVVTSNLTTETKILLQEFYPDLASWIMIQIESMINTLLPHNPQSEANNKQTLLG